MDGACDGSAWFFLAGGEGGGEDGGGEEVYESVSVFGRCGEFDLGVEWGVG